MNEINSRFRAATPIYVKRISWDDVAVKSSVHHDISHTKFIEIKNPYKIIFEAENTLLSRTAY